MRTFLVVFACVALFQGGVPGAHAEERQDGWQGAAYESLVDRPDPHYWRSLIEGGLLVLGGVTWYWIDRERQVADWDFPSWKSRFTLDNWIYDNNTFAINYVWHAVAGGTYHLVARSNNFSLPASFTYGLVTSLAWEQLAEFREKSSFNDVVYTTGSGVVAGEFFYWLGRYLGQPRQRGQGVWSRAARYTLGGPQALHDAIDGSVPRPTPGSVTDNLGYVTPIWHRFDLGVGVGPTRVRAGDKDTTTLHQFRLSGRLVALPGYLRRGSFRQFFGEGNMTELAVDVRGARGKSAVGFLAEVVLLGYYQQRIEDRGSAFMIGSAMSFQYQREGLSPWSDRLAVLSLPGLALDLHGVVGPWQLSFRGRAHVDFAGVEALAHDDWQRAHPDEVEKTILAREGYYYGWGGSVRATVELTSPWMELGGSAFLGRYDSHEGLDRNQSSVTADVDLDDRVTRLDAWIRWKPLGSGYLEARGVHKRRRSKHAEFSARQELTSGTVGIGITF